MKIQEIYLDLMKSKRGIHSKELKYYYLLFTDSKAESLMFEHDMKDGAELLENNKNNRDMLFGLKRLYCRLIEKTMIKISYYLMNSRRLEFIFQPAQELIKKCEVLMRRLHFLRDTGNLNEIV